MMIVDVRKGGTLRIGGIEIVILEGRGRTKVGIEAPPEFRIEHGQRILSSWILNFVLFFSRPLNAILHASKGSGKHHGNVSR